ncbi:MAG TPA: nuclease-related domain-containing protein [Tetragenococcus sp.]|nr:nuclease-related domain-containing protein [Tetragenococcus sp.]
MKRKMSFQLQHLTILKQRIALGKKQLIYQKLLKGYQGETEMDRLFNFHAPKVAYLDDLTLKFCDTIVQVDKIALSTNTVLPFDMKFYEGEYELKNNDWYKNNFVMTHNINEQLRRVIRVLQNAYLQAHAPFEVKGVLAFMNRAAQIKICDNIPETILQYHEIPAFLMQLKPTQNFQWEKILQPFIIPSIRPKMPAVELESLKKGICCRKCQHFTLEEKRYYLLCKQCGHKEPKHSSYVRTVCEYGVLFAEKNLKRKKLEIFFGEDVNVHLLKRVLNQYFQPTQARGHMASYINKALLFPYWFEDQADHFKNLEKQTKWG